MNEYVRDVVRDGLEKAENISFPSPRTKGACMAQTCQDRGLPRFATVNKAVQLNYLGTYVLQCI